MTFKSTDFVGKRYGKLIVIDLVQASGEKRKKALCRCDCGNTKIIAISSLRSGDTTSCGCLWKKAIKKSNSSHGMTGTKLHNTWRGMRARCNIKSCSNYVFYGGRGIKVCKEWNDSFDAFEAWALASGYSDELSIDRIDPKGNYAPENCRWVDKADQARNRRVKTANQTGVTGVSKRSGKESYRVSICINGVNINVGSYKDFDCAVEARKQAELKYWGFTIIG
jgi:hypothetical protein